MRLCVAPLALRGDAEDGLRPATRRWVEQGIYPKYWGCGKEPPPTFPVTQDDYGEPA